MNLNYFQQYLIFKMLHCCFYQEKPCNKRDKSRIRMFVMDRSDHLPF